MLSRIIKHTKTQTRNGIFLGLSLALLSVHSGVADEREETLASPLGSHTDVVGQFANARHLWQSGKLKQAAALYESMIARYPDLPDPYNNLAVIYAAQGDYKKAQQTLEQGLNTHPGYAAIYENLTAIYVEMARDSYGKALQLGDNAKRELKLRALAELSIKPPVQVAMVDKPAAAPVVVAAPVPAPEVTTVAAVETPAVTPPVISAPIPQAVKPVEAKQTAEIAPAPPVIDQTEIIKALESWAEAWSAQSAEQYLSYYEPHFHPAGQSRRRWEAQRIDRIRKPQWIRVSLSDFIVKPMADQRVRVEFVQQYQSNTYSEKGRKEVVLFKTAQGWRIVSERNL